MAAKIAGRINSAFCKCDEEQRALSKHVIFCKKCNDPACHCNGMACNDFCCGWGIKMCSAVPWVIGAGLHAAGSDFMTRQAMPSNDTSLHPGPLILHILCLSTTILHGLLPVMPVGMGRSPGLASKGHGRTASVCWVAGVTVRPRFQACPQPQGTR